jgi:hypothetical protein
MPRKLYEPEEIIVTLRQIEVLTSLACQQQRHRLAGAAHFHYIMVGGMVSAWPGTKS